MTIATHGKTIGSMQVLNQAITDDFAVYHGDNVEVLKGIPSDTVGLSVTSVPFPSMYVYNNTSRDIGNTTGIVQMLEHYRFVARQMLRVTIPGRMLCIHLTNIPVFKHADGFVGRRDFRGDMIRLMQEEDWIYHSEVLIDKCPQLRAQRSKDRGLLFKSLATDSSVMAPVMPDYLLLFRKPGENPFPILAGRSKKYENEKGWITEDEWVEWAHSVWYREIKLESKSSAPLNYPGRHLKMGGIKETDVLNVRVARDPKDSKHLCPLQLGIIHRCVKLWSAPGELVCDPFSGIGSTGFEALRLGRKYLGIELKESYYRQSARYLKIAVSEYKRNEGILDFGPEAVADAESDIPGLGDPEDFDGMDADDAE
jgi:hypothetical protein